MAAGTSTRRKRMVPTAALVALAGIGTLLVAGAAADEVTKGDFAPFATAAPGGPNAEAYGAIAGRAEMVRNDDGTTEVGVDVSGLEPGHKYPVHVHAAPCDPNQADGHYKANPAGASTPPNEIWPGPVAADKSGAASGETVVPYRAGPEAQSVVVHTSDGAKLACADLPSSGAGTGIDTGTAPAGTDTGTAPAGTDTGTAPAGTDTGPAESVPTEPAPEAPAPDAPAEEMAPPQVG